jgi:hypothetical protein
MFGFGPATRIYPEFAAKAAEIVGLYLNPPENALVLSVDEKPSIQALERAQGWIRLPDGKAMNGFSHCYTRHGTTTLFAALDVITGEITTGHYRRRRRREFLDFRNEIVDAHPEREIHGDPGQLEHAKTEAGSLATASSARTFPLHSHLCLLAQSVGMLVQHPGSPSHTWRKLRLAAAGTRIH